MILDPKAAAYYAGQFAMAYRFISLPGRILPDPT